MHRRDGATARQKTNLFFGIHICMCEYMDPGQLNKNMLNSVKFNKCQFNKWSIEPWSVTQVTD